jgi:hypothetical protein
MAALTIRHDSWLLFFFSEKRCQPALTLERLIYQDRATFLNKA